LYNAALAIPAAGCIFVRNSWHNQVEILFWSAVMPAITELFPPLETERLKLVPLSAAYTDFIFHHFSDEAVTRWLLDEPPLSDYAGAEALVRFFTQPGEKTYNRWVLLRKTDQRPIGTVGFHKWIKAYQRAEIGYDLSPDCWRQGYMREALRAVLAHGFNQLGLNRIDALVSVNNPASAGLLEAFHFQQEGILRDYFCQNGVFYDHFIYALLKREWRM
jgi:ribosomal-protein-alanine N-acetyltransferase